MWKKKAKTKERERGTVVRGRGEKATDTQVMLCAHTRTQNLNVAW